MKANSITISVPGKCTRKCPYCISDMTYPVEEYPYLFGANLGKAAGLARRIGVTHVLITGKGEPFDNLKAIKDIALAFPDFYIEVQTHLKDFDRDQLETIGKYSLDLLAISIDHPDQFKIPHWKTLTELNQVIRATVVLTDRFKDWSLVEFIVTCKELGIRQLTIRQPTVPKNLFNTHESKDTAKWIEHHTDPEYYRNVLKQLHDLEQKGHANYIRDLQFGADIWDIQGVSFTAMEYCVESVNGETLRHLIFQSDGHLYTTWDSKGSILW